MNNAGFGLRGAFGDQAWPEAEAMLQVLVVAATELCRGVLPAMRRAGHGRILNVASLAGLIPSLPGSTLYAASKAYLVRLSQSLAAENRSEGLRVVALCPGYVHTEFHAVLGVEERMRRQLPLPLWMEADTVAQLALRALEGEKGGGGAGPDQPGAGGPGPLAARTRRDGPERPLLPPLPRLRGRPGWGAGHIRSWIGAIRTHLPHPTAQQ